MSKIAAKKSAVSARVYLTAKDTDFRLTEVDQLSFRPRKSGPNVTNATHIFADPTKRFQPLLFIGGAATDSAAETLAKLPEAKQQEFFTAQFHPEKGIGYTGIRTNMESCDFSPERFSLVEYNDVALNTFSVAHDLKFKIPMIKRAFEAAGGVFPVFASPWSPPSWMKSNSDTLYGGSLLPQYRDTWARYFVKFIEHYGREGVPIWGVTVQNEPEAVQSWESCIYTPEEERDFIRDHLGPTLHKTGHADVRLIAWDHNRDFMYERARIILEDPEAAKYVWGIGYHWYVQECYDNVALVRDCYPDTHLIFTEGCHYFGDKDKWLNGEKYGLAVINDLNRGCEAWCDWNMILDERGGPNHVGNYCAAPIHADTRTGELTYTPSYYYLGHFSKFIRPGYVRIACSSTSDGVLATAYASPESSDANEIVVVILNKSDREHVAKISIGDKVVATSMPAHSIATVVVKNT